MTGPAPAIVAGLVWSMIDLDTGLTPHEVLTGPAVGAAVGARAHGLKSEMLVAIPRTANARSLALLHSLDRAARLVRRVDGNGLRWTSPRILGTKRPWSLCGDPRRHTVACDDAELDGRILILANGAPDVYASMLQKRRHRFAVMDVDGSWSASQATALQDCMSRVDLVTITQFDLERLPFRARAGVRLGQPGGPALLVKNGPSGVQIRSGGQERRMPAADCREVATDIGAGDVLLGCLAGTLSGVESPLTVDAVAEAYSASLPVIATLLASSDFPTFVSQLAEWR